MEKETDTSNEANYEAALAAKIAEQNDKFRRTWARISPCRVKL